MPSMRDTNRSAWNGSKSSSRSPRADKSNRHADHRHHRQRRAAARVAVDLRRHDAGHADLAVELASALDRVLPRHRVGDIQQVARTDDVLDRDELPHQLIVDVQPARRVDDDDVVADVRAPRQVRSSRAPPDPVVRPGRAPARPPVRATIASC